MYDEDRKLALAMYSDMFDSCRDEELLVQSLGSPTRQAVAVARNYNAKERKQQLFSEDRESTDSGDAPAFLITISTIMDEALEGNKFSNPVDENQFSLFSDDNQPHVDFSQPLPKPAAVAKSAAITFDEADTAEPEAAAPAAVVPEEPVPVRNAISVDDFLARVLYEKPAAVAEEAPVAEPVIREESAADTLAEVSNETYEAVQDSQDPVDRFIADFSISDAVLPEDSAAIVNDSVSADVASEPVSVDEPVSEESYPSLYSEDDFYTEPQLKADTLLLILYIIAAIPLSLIAITVLLVLTAIVLAFAVACIVGGLFVFSAGLSGLTMIADLMVVLGGGIALFALGLLFLWTAVWLVLGGIVGLIRGVVTLAKKWCYKEVEQ